MKRKMLINAVHREQRRMAIVENGKLVEFNIQMSTHDATTGNIYKGVVHRLEKGLQAAFIEYGASKKGFLPLKNVNSNGNDKKENKLTAGQEIIVQVVREQSEIKGALLTNYISLPGRYLVLLPNRNSTGISRKIENEEERKKLASIMAQIRLQDQMGFIVRTAGVNRKKHELLRDYLNILKLYKEIEKLASQLPAPALLHQESDFGVRSLRDYLTMDIEEIVIDDLETFRRMRDYCKIVSPKMVRNIKIYKEKSPIFDQFQLEEQIGEIYRERVRLKSGGGIVITSTEAMITIDVNSSRASSQSNMEATALKTNLEAAEEIARQLRLRDLGGIIVIDFIDMSKKENITEVEKTFRKALSLDRARTQMTKISKFGVMEISRQRKQPTIHEISYVLCPYCRGRGVRPSLEYTALGAYRKIQSQAVKKIYSSLVITMPQEVAQYLLNNKRTEISTLEREQQLSIHISGSNEMEWDTLKIEAIEKQPPLSSPASSPTAVESEKTDSSKQRTKNRRSRRGSKKTAIKPEAPDNTEIRIPPADTSFSLIEEAYLEIDSDYPSQEISEYEDPSSLNIGSLLDRENIKLIEITKIFGE